MVILTSNSNGESDKIIINLEKHTILTRPPVKIEQLGNIIRHTKFNFEYLTHIIQKRVLN